MGGRKQSHSGGSGGGGAGGGGSSSSSWGGVLGAPHAGGRAGTAPRDSRGGSSGERRKARTPEKELARTLQRRERDKACFSVKGGASNAPDRGVMVRIRVDVPGVEPHTWAFPQQPAAVAYGGMGFNRDSVWMSMADDDFATKSAKVYAEHVDFGTTGKAFIKSIKRERELARMPLWRVSLKEKLERESAEAGLPKKKQKTAVPGRMAVACASNDLQRDVHFSAEGGEQERNPPGAAAHPQNTSESCATKKSAKERVKERRKKVVGAVEKRVLPKAAVDVSLQQTAIEAYRQLKQQQAAAAKAATISHHHKGWTGKGGGGRGMMPIGGSFRQMRP